MAPPSPVQLGVAGVSVYAFSIDNYRRSGEEVATLMALAEDKLAHLLQVGWLGACWAGRAAGGQPAGRLLGCWGPMLR